MKAWPPRAGMGRHRPSWGEGRGLCAPLAGLQALSAACTAPSLQQGLRPGQGSPRAVQPWGLSPQNQNTAACPCCRRFSAPQTSLRVVPDHLSLTVLC